MDLPNTRLWRAAPDGKFPSDRRPDHNQRAAVLGSVKARPANDGACGQARATADLDSPCARRPQHVWVGAKKRDSKSNKETGMKEVACSAFTHVAACTLALSPIRDTHSEGFSQFVTSVAAPVASGWSVCRVGLAPTGKRRLVTAHTRSSHRHLAIRSPRRRGRAETAEW